MSEYKTHKYRGIDLRAIVCKSGIDTVAPILSARSCIDGLFVSYRKGIPAIKRCWEPAIA